MTDKTLYRLGWSMVAEPLINNWAAWSHLVSPVPYGLHLKNYQVRVLESYLQDPKSHVEVCKQPQLRSGPFVDIPEARAAEVKQLLEDIKTTQRDKLELGECLIDFHNYLVREAKGESLDPYYEKLPVPLKGRVELVYDYYNRPSVRCLESLLYKSPYYDPSLQAIRLFQHTLDSSRPSIMSTPRLPEENQIHWAIRFEDEKADDFFDIDSHQKPLGYIRELLDLKPRDDHTLIPMLSRRRISPFKQWKGKGMRVRYIGHACVLLEWNGVSILTDPYIGVVPCEGGDKRVRYEQLPAKIDYVLITHNHHDHFCLESLLRLRHKIECLVVPRSFGLSYGDLSLKLLARRLGFKNVVELDALESIPLPDGEIFAIPFMGEHADFPHGKIAYVVRTGNEQTLFAADSDCLDKSLYHHIREILGPLHNVFLGMECVGAPLSWSCGSFLPERPEYGIEQSRRYKGCDARRALSILEATDARRIFIYAMGLEPWLEYMLGLALTKDSPQIKESARAIELARQRGLADAQLLNGPCDFVLGVATPGAEKPASLIYKDHESRLAAEAVHPRRGSKGYRLSPEQRLVWQSLKNDEMDSCDYISAAARLDGRLNAVTLIQAFNEIKDRHEILCVRFHTVGGKPRQFVLRNDPILLWVEDLRQYPIEQREALALKMIESGSEKPFDLQNGPLIRARLVEIGDNKHILIIELHRIAGDAPSLDFLIQELACLYTAFAEGKPSPLPSQATQYLDYICYQEKRSGSVLHPGKLESEFGAMTFQPKPVGQQLSQPRRQARYGFAIADHSLEAIARLCRQRQVEIFDGLLAAFSRVLYRFNGETDIQIGWHIYERSDFDRSGIVGCFTNVVVARFSLSGIKTFEDSICKARDINERARENYSAARPALLTEPPQGDENDYGSSLQGWFVFRDLKGQIFDMGDLKMTRIGTESESSPADLCLSICDWGAEVSAELSYNPDVYSESVIAELASQYCALLEEVKRPQEKSFAAAGTENHRQKGESPADFEDHFLFD